MWHARTMGLNYGSSSTASSGGGGGCCRCTCVKSQMAALIVLFLSLSLSFVLLILAGTAKPGSWLPMINIIAVVFLPMFILIADTIGGAPTVMHDCEWRARPHRGRRCPRAHPHPKPILHATPPRGVAPRQ